MSPEPVPQKTAQAPEPAPAKAEPEPPKAVPATKGKRKEGGAKASKPREREARKEGAPAPKPPAPGPADAVKESLVRFMAVRVRERYPETRRILPGPIRAIARSRVEEHPEVLEAYRKNRRRGEQEALPLVLALSEELAGRAPKEEGKA
jgi:hypothetical protein